jgi:demethylmenaquinone methyltransferase/2-methoxy-6-polyprenyl-1,4-benzoquinol methylase
MARVVSPTGTVAILIYSSQLLLPGYPVLEAHLNATSAGIAPFTKGARPETHYLRALGWLREAGLADIGAETFPQTFQAPLQQEVRDALISLIDMRWPGALAELPPEERSLYERLTSLRSPDFILDHPDYYGFFTYTMFRGRVTS